MTLKQLVKINCKACGHKPTQEEIASKIGCHPAALSHWLSGRRKMSLANACKVAKALGAKVHVFNDELEFSKEK